MGMTVEELEQRLTRIEGALNMVVTALADQEDARELESEIASVYRRGYQAGYQAGSKGDHKSVEDAMRRARGPQKRVIRSAATVR